MRIAASFRLVRAGWSLVRAGVLGFVDRDLLSGPGLLAYRIGRVIEPSGLDLHRRGERVRETLNRLGPSYIKLGQFLATRPDVVGAELAEALSLLKDGMADFGMEAALDRMAFEFERPVDEVFESVSAPVAAASIAQVHRAVRVDEDGGESSWAVKVLRPGVRRRFARDLESFYMAARTIERLAPAARRLRPIAVVDVLARSVTLEMDMRIEAAAYSEMADDTCEDLDFRVPAVDWLLTGRDVLVTQWIDGVKLSRPVAEIDAAGHDRVVLAATIVQAFLRHALDHGFFHADMHEGNLFVDDAGRLVAVDLGIMGRIGMKERRFLAEILYGFIRRDYRRVAEIHFEAGYVPRNHSVADFAQALRSIGEPIHGQRASSISMAKLLGLLFEITDIFDMETRPELIMLQKTMVVVEGVARRLDPDFDMWSTAEPVVRAWVTSNLGPAAQVERGVEGARTLLGALAQAPEFVGRAERIADQFEIVSREGVTLSEASLERLSASVARRNRTSFLIIAGLVVLLLILILMQ